MFAFLFGYACIFSKDTYSFCVGAIRREIVVYANARKRIHIGFNVLIYALEIGMLFLVHDLMAHAALSSGVLAWESLVASLGEEV